MLVLEKHELFEDVELFNSHIKVVHLLEIAEKVLEDIGFQFMRDISIDLVYRNAKESITILFNEPAVKLAFYFFTFMGYLPEIVELFLRKYVVSSNI